MSTTHRKPGGVLSCLSPELPPHKVTALTPSPILSPELISQPEVANLGGVMTTEDRKVYLVRGGRFGEDEDYALENGLAIIGFRDFPSLANLDDWQAAFNLATGAQPELKPRAVGNFAGQLWAPAGTSRF